MRNLSSLFPIHGATLAAAALCCSGGVLHAQNGASLIPDSDQAVWLQPSLPVAAPQTQAVGGVDLGANPRTRLWDHNSYASALRANGLGSTPRSALGYDLAPQEEDYSFAGMLQKEHGTFLLERERFTPYVRASYMTMPDTNIDSESGNFDLHRYRIEAELPFAIGPHQFLTIGGRVDTRTYDTSANLQGFSDEDLTAIAFNVGLGIFLSDDVLFEARVSPGIRSDLGGTLKSDDYILYGDTLLTWRAMDRFYFKIGAAYNNVFRDSPAVPLIGFSWAASDAVRLDILLPLQAELTISPNAAWDIYGGVQIDGDQFNVRGPSGLGVNRDPSAEVNVQEIMTYIGTQVRLTDNFSIDGRIGLTVAGDYKLTNQRGVTADGTLEPQVFFEVGAGWTF